MNRSGEKHGRISCETLALLLPPRRLAATAPPPRSRPPRTAPRPSAPARSRSPPSPTARGRTAPARTASGTTSSRTPARTPRTRRGRCGVEIIDSVRRMQIHILFHFLKKVLPVAEQCHVDRRASLDVHPVKTFRLDCCTKSSSRQKEEAPSLLISPRQPASWVFAFSIYQQMEAKVEHDQVAFILCRLP